MNRWLFIFGLFCLTAWTAAADALVEAYSRGNQAFADGALEEAVAAYEAALTHGESANLHFNLANAYAGLERWGPAVLHYHKALALNPQHRDARVNLHLIRGEIGVAQASPDVWQRWAETLPLTLWIVAGSVAFWVLLALWGLLRKRFHAPRIRAILTLIALPVLLATFPALYGYHIAAKVGIVMADAVALRVAPTGQSPTSTTLNAGSQATIRRVVNNFYLVELPTGEEGYLTPSEIVPVWDSAPTPNL